MADDNKKKRDIEELQKEAIEKFKKLDDVDLMEVTQFFSERDLLRIIGGLRSPDLSINVKLPLHWNGYQNIRRVAEKLICAINKDVMTKVRWEDDGRYVIMVSYPEFVS